MPFGPGLWPDESLLKASILMTIAAANQRGGGGRRHPKKAKRGEQKTRKGELAWLNSA
jgi:hypothetical protein